MRYSAAFRALRKFRTALQDAFYRRAGAQFDLVDALLATGAVPSPVHLSLAPAHQPGWGSLHAALRKGRVDRLA